MMKHRPVRASVRRRRFTLQPRVSAATQPRSATLGTRPPLAINPERVAQKCVVLWNPSRQHRDEYYFAIQVECGIGLRGEAQGVCLAQPSGLGNGSKKYFEGQRPGNLSSTWDWFARSVPFQTAGPSALRWSNHVSPSPLGWARQTAGPLVRRCPASCQTEQGCREFPPWCDAASDRITLRGESV